MKRRTFLAAASALSLIGHVHAKPGTPPPSNNPLLAPWTGPFEGVPPFDKIKPAMFPAAFQAAIVENRAEVAKIANNPAPADFANTIAALENSGRTYGRLLTLFGIYTSTLNTKEVQAIDTTWRPKFAAFNDEIIQNPKLFARIEKVYNSPAKARLTAEQQRLCWVYYTNFSRSGAQLNAADKAQLTKYNGRLATLYAKFSQNVLADEENYWLVLEEADTKGLPSSVLDSAAAAAKEKKLPGKWVISNTRSAMEPFLTYAENRALREKGWRMWISRGDNGNKADNNKVIPEILQLRARRAKLLGSPTFAHWRLENSMAKTPETAMKLMMQVWPAAVARVKEEVADMQAVADKEGAALKIEPWDYRFYAEKVRKAKYDLNAEEIKPYFQLENLRNGLFYMARQLYGFEFTEVKNLPLQQPDVRTWEVKGADGKHVGLWYFDPYARAAKVSGAWMNEYRTQENFLKPVTTIVSNNANFNKAVAGSPVLLSWDDAETMFHEFGHALHGLNSQVHYPMLAGTNVARDFVEFPSQLHENWLSTPEILNRFALHATTGEPMPAALVDKIHKAATFNQGFATVEYLSSAIVDMKIHLAGDVAIDTKEFEKTALAELGMPKEMVMRHRLPQFNHLFSDDGYAAGYYSYLWSEVLDHDAFQAFMEGSGPYDKAVAKRFRDNIMKVGNTIDPAQAYRNFRGRDASIVPLLKHRGFPTP